MFSINFYHNHMYFNILKHFQITLKKPLNYIQFTYLNIFLNIQLFLLFLLFLIFLILYIGLVYLSLLQPLHVLLLQHLQHVQNSFQDFAYILLLLQHIRNSPASSFIVLNHCSFSAFSSYISRYLSTIAIILVFSSSDKS